jgi:lipopolysaccharide transport system ATP-binding protein
MKLAIRVDNLTKKYHLGHSVGRGDRTFREALADLASAPARRLRMRGSGSGRSPASQEEFFALRDITFQIQPGEIVGIVGRNGAGKSTLLKILCRITEPTSGRAELRGRLGSLLEVGTGFHPELTGRENIFLNGSILGMTRREIKAKFDEIVAFAEIGKFLDTPVKRYSSGMYVRLAFAVAAHLEPEILLVDEVLAVGDAAFQRKCLGKMGDVARQGRTILFVSHNMAAITRLCTRGVWLERGELRAEGPIGDVVGRYLSDDTVDAGELAYRNPNMAPGSEEVRLVAVRVINHTGGISSSIDARHPFQVEVEFDVLKEVANLRVGFCISTNDGTPVLTTTDADDAGHDLLRAAGRHVSRCTLPGGFLNFGQYFVSVGCDFPMRKVHFSVDPALAIHIEQTGGVGSQYSDGRRGFVRMQFPWDRQSFPSNGSLPSTSMNGSVA